MRSAPDKNAPDSALVGHLVEAHRAGSHPKTLHPNAVRAMRDEHGIDLAGHHSKQLSVFAQQRFDRVISLCVSSTRYPSFQQTAAELETRIVFLLATLTAPVAPS